jgi:hypothetical protein
VEFSFALNWSHVKAFGAGPETFGTDRVGNGVRADGIGLGSGLKKTFGAGPSSFETCNVGVGARADGIGLFGTGLGSALKAFGT